MTMTTEGVRVETSNQQKSTTKHKHTQHTATQNGRQHVIVMAKCFGYNLLLFDNVNTHVNSSIEEKKW
jgi:hypothetical protein